MTFTGSGSTYVCSEADKLKLKLINTAPYNKSCKHMLNSYLCKLAICKWDFLQISHERVFDNLKFKLLHAHIASVGTSVCQIISFVVIL